MTIRSQEVAAVEAPTDSSSGTLAPAAVSDEASLQDFAAVVWQRRMTTLSWTLGLLALALVYLALATPLYTASTSILLDPGTRPPLGSDQAAVPQSPDTMMIESQVRVIASDNVLRKVVASEKLEEDPEFVSDKPGLRARLFAMLGLGGAASPAGERSTRAIMALERVLAVKRSERTYVVDVEVSSPDPAKAARLANAVAAAYLDDQQDAKAKLASGQGAYLKSRLEELQGQLQTAENNVEAFKEQNRIFGANGKLVNEDQLSEINTELARARVRTAQARAKYEQVRRILESGRVPDALDDALRSPAMEKLRAQYADIVRQEANYRATLGDRHPAYIEVQSQLRDTRRLITEELKRVTDAAANEYQLARDAEAQIGKQVDIANQATTATNQSLVRLRELEREVDASRAVYERFLRARETVKEEGADLPTARVIAPASTPFAPSSPKRLAILALALITGLGLGVATALMQQRLGIGRDQLGQREAAAQEGKEGQTDVPSAPIVGPDAPEVIGAIPRVPSASRSKLAGLARWLHRFGRSKAAEEPAPTRLLWALVDAPDSAFSNAIRALREELRSAAGGRRVKVVLVTSDEPGVGKSTIAVNLARAAAERGERVLAIDANPANPTLGQLVMPQSDPGLIELAGTTRLIYTVDRADEGTLSIVPILADEPVIVRRLLRHTSVEPLDGIKSNFDFVVIDGPTIGDDDTARMVAEAVDQVVLVMPSAAPQRETVEDALDRLEVPNWKFRGAVLSKVDVKAAA
ncbi:MAG: polysaccharide biosynthesis tyrosine autokinase [Methylobacteriaceae bacterium]|nr:polysaccharide biosynthesis tyrosine autokinase [Methylobacteriaceae bacterium]